MPFQRSSPEDTAEFTGPKRSPESPFLDEELFAPIAEDTAEKWPQRLAGDRLDSPFQYAFDPARETIPPTLELNRQVGAWSSEDGAILSVAEATESFEPAEIEGGVAEEFLPDWQEDELAAAHRSPFRTPEEAEDFEETTEDYADEETSLAELRQSPQKEYDVSPTVSWSISDALSRKDWARALELAIREGWRDENKLTNLLFFERHPELGGRQLDPAKTKEDQKLSQE
jgi:hypothetical protein